MQTSWIRRFTAGTGLLAAACVAVATAADTKVPPEVAGSVIERDIAFLQKGLAGKPEKRAVPTLKAAAMLIALHAQNTGQAGLRDQALKVAGAIAEKNFDAAKTAAEGLKSGTAGGKVTPVDLAKQHEFDLAELMSTYRAERVGGLNMEKDIKVQGRKFSDVKLAGDIGARVVLISHYTRVMPYDRAAANAANTKKWEAMSDETEKIAGEIATEAAKGDSADKKLLADKLKALDASCTACHTEFRD